MYTNYIQYRIRVSAVYLSMHFLTYTASVHLKILGISINAVLPQGKVTS